MRFFLSEIPLTQKKIPAPPMIGPWAVLHEIRSDYAQIMCCVFLLIAGPGAWSLDALLARKRLRRPDRARTLTEPAAAHS